MPQRPIPPHLVTSHSTQEFSTPLPSSQEAITPTIEQISPLLIAQQQQQQQITSPLIIAKDAPQTSHEIKIVEPIYMPPISIDEAAIRREEIAKEIDIENTKAINAKTIERQNKPPEKIITEKSMPTTIARAVSASPTAKSAGEADGANPRVSMTKGPATAVVTTTTPITPVSPWFSTIRTAINSVSDFYKDLNPSTLSGAIDVIVVQAPDGSLRCSPFQVRFGKMHLLRPQEKIVTMTINGVEYPEFEMRLGDSGEAFFIGTPIVREPRGMDIGEPEDVDMVTVQRRAKSAEPVLTKARTLSAPELPTVDEDIPKPTKTLRLTSDQLKKLKLKSGANPVIFSVTTKLQGKALCAANIFFWKSDVNILISDIDGTITKSDALGHLFTMVGKDWTHPGVAKLFTRIHSNGYEIIYLTSRAIGQASLTRDYLRGIEQDKYRLPAGPVIMSPDRLFTAFRREVIDRRPEIFKIAALRDVRSLFSTHAEPLAEPFWAGFGNRITDAMAYRSVGVPSSRIFTIDTGGEIKLELLASHHLSSYIKLNDVADHIFPPVKAVATAEEPRIHGQYSDVNYWRKQYPEPDFSALFPSEEDEDDSQYGDDDEDEDEDDVEPVRAKIQLFEI